ncbi:unnamed protein product [Somion occarium]|uniref:Uncharacterized protein n=1 Tax=Somion occarium TaxID=3059160 RepID=A0ABP1CSY0_9APHY
MFSKAILVAFLSLALAANAAPAFNKDACSAVVSTVTVTAPAAVNTGNTLAVGNQNGGNNGNTKGGNNANNGGNAANNGNNAANGNNNNKGGNANAGGNANNGQGAATTTSAAAAATSSAAAAGGNNGGNANNGTNNGNNNGNNNNGNNNGNGNAGGDAQTSLTLDPSVLAKGFENDGQDQPAAGQVASLTSSNNFINFCATVANLPITNGQQVKTGSCNPAPMGIIAATTNMPSSKFSNPKNFDTIKANTAFTISMAIKNLETGHFTNAQENYFAAPQQINAGGTIQGHSHVVIEQIDAIDSTAVTDPTKFAFFKGLNDAAQGGVLTADVTNGLPAGSYRLASINSAANHQPVLVAVAQHGSLDDMVYFTVTNDGKAAAGAGNAAGGNAAAGNATDTGAAAAASASATAAAGKGNNNGGNNNNKGGNGNAQAGAAQAGNNQKGGKGGKRWFF